MARILLIEDKPSNAKLVRFILEHAGHEVLHATTAAEGLSMAAALAPQLVLMDMHLPDVDGLQATAALRASPGTRALPIIALTALAMAGDRERILAAGCDDYLAKPFHHAELVDKVGALLDRSRSSAA